jgi:hypothetical protein
MKNICISDFYYKIIENTTPGFCRDLDKDEKEVLEQHWQKSCRENPMLHDGEILCTTDPQAKKGFIEVGFTPYKYFYLKDKNHKLADLTAIAVSGLLLVSGINKEKLSVLGKRSEFVTQYPGYWELIPSGGISRQWLKKNNEIDFYGCLLQELEEETGNKPEINDFEQLGIIYDQKAQCLDFCFCLYTAALCPEKLHSTEYSAYRTIKPELLLQEKQTNKIVPTSLEIIRLFLNKNKNV